MEKLKNLALICLLVLSIVACSDDDKSSNNSQEEVITSEFIVEMNSKDKNTITFTNPLNKEATLEAQITIHDDSNSIQIDTISTTCTIDNKLIETILPSGSSCDLVYTYQPTEFNTKLLSIDIDYRASMKSICPTKDTVPTYKQYLDLHKHITMKVYNYAKNNNREKSPAFTNINIDTEWIANSISEYSKNLILNAKEGEYTYTLSRTGFETNNENCSLSETDDGNILIVKGNNGCSLKAIARDNYKPTITTFIPKKANSPYYNVSVGVNSKYEYNKQNSFLNSEYFAAQNQQTVFDIVMLENDEEIIDYEITGDNASKFKVASTKHNSCNIIDKKIAIPQDQKNCFFTVAIKDTSENGSDFKAELNTKFSSGETKKYEIDGEINNLSIEQILQTICQRVE